VLAAQRERDVLDQSGGHRATLEAPKDSVPVDTTGLTLEEVVDQVVTLAIEAKEIEA
jgi:CMP/dCMP kinase